MGEFKTAYIGELVQEIEQPDDSARVYAVVNKFDYSFKDYVHGNLYDLTPWRGLWNNYSEWKEKRGAEVAWKHTNFEKRYKKQLKTHEECQDEIERLLEEVMIRDVWLVTREQNDDFSYREVLKRFLVDKKDDGPLGSDEHDSEGFLNGYETA